MKINTWFLVFLLSGCSYSTFYVPEHQGVYHPTEAKDVVVSPQDYLQVPYKTLGLVAASVAGDGDEAKAKLQAEAAKIGANAVIHLQLERYLGRTSASGTAVLVYQK